MNNKALAAELRKTIGAQTVVPLPKLKRDVADRLERLDEALRMASSMCNEIPMARLRTIPGVRNTYELATFFDQLLE